MPLNGLNPTIEVPQGSTLGPLLYYIDVYDMPICCSVVKPILFGDDTTLLASLNEWKELAVGGKHRLTGFIRLV